MTKMTNCLCKLFLVQCLVTATFAFSARSVTRHQQSKSVQTLLQSSLSSFSEQDAAYMMAKARECAFNDSCSVEESREHLHDVLRIQVACASGAVRDSLVCGDDDNDQSELAAIVSGLKRNMQTHEHGLTTRQRALVETALLPAIFLVLTGLSMLLVNNNYIAMNPDVVPFTPQEIAWALRDGYIDDLVSHFLRHGGLYVGDGKDAMLPFTSQELAWAIQGGYLDDFLRHFLRNGGL